MRLFLIRHGETEHNVAGLLAGVSDSILTNHGVLQTQRLGKHLSTGRSLLFTRIYASDLQRAYLTAEELRKHQFERWKEIGDVPPVVKLALLREQDFGSFELMPWASKRANDDALDSRVPNPGDVSFKPKESLESIGGRAQEFVADFILPLLALGSDEAEEASDRGECVAVVSHGIFLASLWRTLLSIFGPGRVVLGPQVVPGSAWRPLAYLPSWSNTGYLELTISRTTASVGESVAFDLLSGRAPSVPDHLATFTMNVEMVNGKEHLASLKRTRGGLGSATFDARQQRLDGFFKRPRTGES